MPDPWETAAQRYAKGGVYIGEVKGTTKNGNLIIELEPGVTAICRRLPIDNPAIGTAVRVWIGIISKEHRIIRGGIAGESRWIS